MDQGFYAAGIGGANRCFRSSTRDAACISSLINSAWWRKETCFRAEQQLCNLENVAGYTKKATSGSIFFMAYCVAADRPPVPGAALYNWYLPSRWQRFVLTLLFSVFFMWCIQPPIRNGIAIPLVWCRWMQRGISLMPSLT